MLRQPVRYQQHGPELSISVGTNHRKPPASEDWVEIKPVIEQLYVIQDKTLLEVSEILLKEYGFKASPRMYKQRIAAWNFEKNCKREDWLAIAALLGERQQLGKRSTVFTVRGRKRTVKDLQKYTRTQRMTCESFLALSRNTKAPDYIRASTPDDDDVANSSPSEASSSNDFSPSPPSSRISAPSISISPAGNPTEFTFSDYRPAYDACSIASNVTAPSSFVTASQSPYTVASTNTDFPGTPTSQRCNALQQQVELMGFQVVNPAPLESRYGMSDIDTWTLVIATENPEEFDFLCSRCNQKRSEHFISLDTLVDCEQPRNLLNDADGAALQIPASTRDDGPWRWVSRCFLACIYLTEGNHELSKLALDAQKVEFQKLLYKQDSMTLTSTYLVTSMIHMHDQGDIAGRIMDSAFSVAATLLEPDDPIRVTIEYLTAAIDSRQDLQKTRFSSNFLKSIYEQFQTNWGERHPNTVTAYHNVAWKLKYEGKWEESEREFQRVHKLASEVFGESHLQTVFALAGLAGAQLGQNKTTDAIVNFEKVIALTRPTLGPSHPYHLEGKRRLAGLFKQQDRDEEAEQLYWSVLEGRVKMLGRDHPYTEGARLDVEGICKERGTWNEMSQRRLQAIFEPPERSRRSRSSSESSSASQFAAY